MSSSQRTYVSNGAIVKNPPPKAIVSGAAGSLVTFFILYFWTLSSFDSWRAAQNCPYRRAADGSQRPQDWGMGYRSDTPSGRGGNVRNTSEFNGPVLQGPVVPTRCRSGI